MTDSPSCPLFGPIDYRGEVQLPDAAYPVTFVLTVDDNSELSIALQDISADLYVALARQMGRPGAVTPEFSMQGGTSDGGRFHSDSLSVTGHRSGSTGFQVTLDHRKAVLTHIAEAAPPGDRRIARLWFRGFRAIRTAPVAGSLGEVTLWGAARRVARDDVSGGVQISAAAEQAGPDWGQRADAFLSDLTRGLAFAQGQRLQVPRFDLIEGRKWTVTFYDGQGTAPGLPAIHKLQQDAYLAALVRRIDRDPPIAPMLWTATGWLNAGGSIDELRFLTLMTALETIVEHLVPKSATTLLPKAKFQPLRDALLGTLAAHPQITGDVADILRGRLRGLNTRSLSGKLAAMATHYTLPTDLFEPDSIRALIRLRNALTHSGSAPPGCDLWMHILLLREMITLIVFAEIGYRGPYESYARGYRSAHFPPED